MFEFDAGKLVIIGIVALIVIGPKELPRVMRQVGQAISKLRRLSSDFQAQFMEAIREADLDEIKTEATKLTDAARIDTHFDPLADIRNELTKSIDAQPLDKAPERIVEPLAAVPVGEVVREDLATIPDPAALGEAMPLDAEPPMEPVPPPEIKVQEPASASEPLHKQA
jgi:sec-independent protein translocase protein TatB